MVFAAISFVIILITLLFAYQAARERAILEFGRDDMEKMARHASSQLVLDTGQPQDWNQLSDANFTYENITTLGLTSSQPWVLDFDKLLKMVKLDDDKYEDVKKILGLQGPGYELYFEIWNRFGFTTLAGFFNASGPGTIAYTYALDTENSSNSSNYGILAYFEEKGIPIDNYREDYKSLIGNISGYQVVIFENPMLDETDLSQAEKGAITDFVSGGGIYFQKGFGHMIKIFNLETNNVAHEDGVVLELDSMLRDVEVGDLVAVEGGLRINKQGNMVVVIESISGHLLAGHLGYGSGMIYYFPYSIGTVKNASGTIKHTNTRDIINLPYSDSTSVKFGLDPRQLDNVSEIVKVPRLILVEENLNLTSSWFDFYLWRYCHGPECDE